MNPDLLAGVAADPAMDFLGVLPETATAILSRALGREVQVAAIRVIRHKPGRRCVIEYDLHSGDEPPRTVVGKVRAKGPDQRTFSVLRALWESGFDEGARDGIHIPEPLAIVPEYRMVLSAKAPGVSAAEFVNSRNTGYARHIAKAAWKLHSAGIPVSKTHTSGDELQILRDRLGKVAVAHPDWAERLERLLNRCEQLVSRLPPAQPVGIHRDFYPAQVLFDRPRCWLLDLDLYCLGDPAVDIGNFIGHMTEQSLRTAGHPDAFLINEVALRDEYLRRTGKAVTAEAINTYKLLTVARHIYISTLFPDRHAATARLLEYCEREI
jgi:hypothetical protein